MVYFIVAPRGFERTQTRSLVSVHHSASFRVFSCRFVSFRVFCVARRLASAIGAATSHGRKNAKQRLFSSRRRSAVAAAASALVLTVVRSTSTCGRRNHRPRRELIPPPSPPPPLRALFRGPRNPPPPPPPPPPPLASLLPGPSSLFRLRTTTTRRTARLGISASSGSRGGASPFSPSRLFLSSSAVASPAPATLARDLGGFLQSLARCPASPHRWHLAAWGLGQLREK